MRSAESSQGILTASTGGACLRKYSRRALTPARGRDLIYRGVHGDRAEEPAVSGYNRHRHQVLVGDLASRLERRLERIQSRDLGAHDLADGLRVPRQQEVA